VKLSARQATLSCYAGKGNVKIWLEEKILLRSSSLLKGKVEEAFGVATLNVAWEGFPEGSADHSRSASFRPHREGKINAQGSGCLVSVKTVGLLNAGSNARF